MNEALIIPVSTGLAKRRFIAIAAMIGSAACWGFATVMSRDILATMTSSSLLVIQLTASVAALLLLSIPHLARRHFNRSLARAASIGILEPGLTYTIGLAGLSMTTAGSASVISATEPVLIVLVAWLLLGHKPSARLALSIVIAVIGLVMVSGEALLTQETKGGWGDGLIVLATLFAASYVVLSSKVIAGFPAATLAAAQQMVGLGFAILVFSAIQIFGLEQQSLEMLPLPVIAYAALSGIIQYALAFWLYLVGLRTLSPGAAGLWLTLVPVFGLFGAYLWLAEIPSLPMLLGAGLILSAVVLGNCEK